jgi:glycosyltransferase involved in cell wall biosynthesis
MTTENAKNLWRSAQECIGQNGSLSVIMPAYGLETVIERNVETVCAFLRGNIPFEVVPVDDGSKDGTAIAIRRAAEHAPEHVHPVYVAVNAGKGNALKRGFAASRGSHILLLDADLDLSPSRITTFFDVMAKKRADIVIGSKRHPDSVIDYPWHRRLASGVYFTIVRLLVGLPISDTQTGMKLFKREALEWAFDRMLVKTFAFDLEILSIAHAKGYSVAEAPIEMHFGNKVGCLSWNSVKQVMNDTLAIFYRLYILRYYENVEVAPPADKPPLVSIIIACPAPSSFLTECLKALAAQTYSNFEVIVLPDEPADLGHQPFDLRVLATGKKRPAEKRNAGIRAARGEIVAFLDDDAFPCSNWLEHAVAYFTLPDVGGVGGPGVTPSNDPFLAQAGGRVLANPFVSGNLRWRYIGDHVRSNVDDVPSCNLFVRTDVLRAINGYRTDFWPGEDTILCSDIVFGQKKRIVYDPWAVVYHHRRPLFGPHLRQIGRYALHRGHFAKRFPKTSLRLSYLIPSLFVLGLVVGAGLSFLHPWLRNAYFAVLACYGTITFVSSFSTSPSLWITTWAGVIATHIVYGVRFLTGLLSKHMPCEVAAFDHPAEKG